MPRRKPPRGENYRRLILDCLSDLGRMLSMIEEAPVYKIYYLLRSCYARRVENELLHEKLVESTITALKQQLPRLLGWADDFSEEEIMTLQEYESKVKDNLDVVDEVQYSMDLYVKNAGLTITPKLMRLFYETYSIKDRELAKALDLSRSTITRKRLDQEPIHITEYISDCLVRMLDQKVIEATNCA